jgi:hypothetical protein
VSIASLSVRGGVAPWVDTVIEWQGSSTTWTLTETTGPTTLYTGTALRFDMTTLPETIYWFKLADDTGHSVTAAYVTPPISAPVDLQAVDISSKTATLKWLAVESATQYEVLVDETSVNVLPPPPPVNEEDVSYPTLPLSGLNQDQTYSAQARAFLDTTSSLWSPTIYFTTDLANDVEASEYYYEPSQAQTWNPNGWLADGTPLIHGDGTDYADLNGIHTTVFIYSADTLRAIRELKGANVLSAQVSLTRSVSFSDPRMAMSHWLLHNMTAIPAVAPTFVGSAQGVDSGQVALGQQSWIPLPTGWADAIINGTAAGVAWGGVAGRYMHAAPLANPVVPINGTLLITVG